MKTTPMSRRVAAAIVFWAGALFAASPMELNYQGKMTNSSGNPLSGPHSIRFQVFDAATNGNSLYNQLYSNVPMTNGVFNVVVTGIGASVFTGGVDRWLQVEVDGTPLSPRQKLVASPYALAVAAGSVTDAEVASGAGIVYSKLNLGGNVTNADIAANANIAGTKIAGGNFGTGNYVFPGTMTVSGLSQFGGLSRSTFTSAGALNMAANADITLAGTGEVRGLPAMPSAGDAAASKTYVDSAAAGANLWTLSTPNIFRNSAAAIGATSVANGTLVVRSTSVTAGNPVLNIQDNSGAELMRVQQNGRVGIGNTSPLSPLTIGTQGAGGENLRLTPAAGATIEGGQLTLIDAVGLGGWEIDNFGGAGVEGLRFFRDKSGENIVTAMVISTAGYVGVGTANPSSSLHVAGNIAVSGTVDGYDISVSGLLWDKAMQWDGGSTGLTAATGRSSLGLGSLATQNSVAWGSVTGQPAFAANAQSGRVRMYETGCSSSWDSSCDGNTNGWPDYADSAGGISGGFSGTFSVGPFTCNTNHYDLGFSNGALFSATPVFNGGCSDDDIAERYGTDEPVHRGDLVALSDRTTSRDFPVSVLAPGEGKGTKYTITTANVRKATASHRDKLIGGVPSAPFKIGDDVINPADNPQWVAIIGHIPVRMTLDGGPIAIGDPITVSNSTPGAGMKATTSGRIVGYALEPFRGSGDSKDGMIEVFLAPQDWVAGGAGSENGELKAKISDLAAQSAALKAEIDDLRSKVEELTRGRK